MTGLIIGLVLLAGIGCAGAYFYYKVKHKVERFSMEAFGTRDLVQGLSAQADELATTPKSVSGMTRLMEPQIQHDFPEFNWLQFKNKAENMLVSAFAAIEEKNPALVKDASEEVKKQIENQIRANESEGIREIYDRVHVHQTEIANYTKSQGTCVIKLQSALEYVHYKEKDGNLIEGNKERLQQTKYNTELLYIQDETLAKIDNAVGTTCPHCGAPITNLGAKYCEYCGQGVVELNLKVWSLHKFYEVDYHKV